MRKAQRELRCVVCGKRFSVEMPDYITPENAMILRDPRCRLHKTCHCKKWK